MDPKSPPTATLEQRLIAICQTVRKEALDPALHEAEATKRQAEREREEILKEAKIRAKAIIEEAEKKAISIRKVLESSLEQASSQAVELLKEEIEKNLFNPSLNEYIASSFALEKETASLVESLVQAIDAGGIFGSIAIELGKTASKEKIVQQLGTKVIARLQNGSIQVGMHNWGIIVRIKDKQIVLDVSDKAVRELMANFLRQEFRKMLFI
ncbi:MAG: hypothetical protein QRY74_03955 [Chlamydia sp.]